MNYGQIMKDLLRRFFPEFMALFFPKIARRLDFSRIEFLDKEVFTDLPEGAEREMDLVVLVYTRRGEPEVFLIHVEFQSERRTVFRQRMFEYYAALWLRHKLPIIPIVVYLAPGTGGIVTEQFKMESFGRSWLTFRYAAIGLPDLSASDYVKQENPLGPTFSAMMRSTEANRARRRYDILRRHPVAATDDAARSLLVHFVESLLPLSEEEEFEYRSLVIESGGAEVQQYTTSFHRAGIKEGIVQGMQTLLISLLEARFGPLSEQVRKKVEGIEASEELEALSLKVLTAKSLEEMGL
jgi:hypothetical protein